MTQTDFIEYFAFLDELHESGETNMFGAGPFVSDEFGLYRREAREVVSKWMDTFDPNKSVQERAALAAA